MTSFQDSQSADELPTLRFNPETSRAKAVLLFSMVAFGFGVQLVFEGVWPGLLLIVLFGFSTIASLSVVLPGACFLEINPIGVTIASSFRLKEYRWDQIERIGLFEIGVVKRIGLDLNSRYRGPERVPNYLKPSTGFHVTLPAMSGMDPEGLIEVMQQCHLSMGMSTTSK